MSAIEWRHDGRRILIPVSVLAPAPSTLLTGIEGTALLDTGATTSGVRKSVAEGLGLVGRGKRPLGSAQGEGQAERYLFRLGLWPDRVDDTPLFPFLFDEVIGFELANSFQFEALLGMDILSQCDFAMDRQGLCRLRFG